MNNTNKKTNKKKSVISILLMIAILITGAFAFLSATDSKTNVFTVGNVNIELIENFDTNLDGKINRNMEDAKREIYDSTNTPEDGRIAIDGTIVPGQTVLKQPYIRNTGKNSAWTYIAIGIPTATSAQVANNAFNENAELSIDIKAYAVQDGYGNATDCATIWSKYLQTHNDFGKAATDTNDRIELFTVNNLSPKWTQIKWNDSDFVFQAENGMNYYVFGYSEKLEPKTNGIESDTACLFESVTLIDSIGTLHDYTLSFPEGTVYKDTDSYSVESSAPLTKFASVTIDGKTIDENKYTISGVGSTLVTFTDKDMLTTLTTSAHDVDVIATDGNADGVFTRKDINCSHDFDDDNICKLCGDEKPGFYDENDNLIVAWEDSGIDATKDYDYLWKSQNDEDANQISTEPYGDNHYEKIASSGKNVIKNYPETRKIVLPNNLIKIGQAAFYDCNSVEEIYISDATTDIGEASFGSIDSIKEINFGANITSLKAIAPKCPNLLRINVDLDNDNYCDKEGIVFSRDLTRLVAYPAGNTNVSYEIPTSVDTIIRSAFVGATNLQSIIFSDNITDIQERAFEKCYSLKEISLPPKITTISVSAFQDCRGLETVVLNDNVQTIQYSAFSCCISLKNINFPNSLTTIDATAFKWDRGLEEITLPNSLTSIGTETFKFCKGLKTINWGNGLTTIPRSAFSTCRSLTNVTIPNSITTIEKTAFYDCNNLESIIIGDGVQTIGYGAFTRCPSIKSIVLGKNVQTIEYGAFMANPTQNTKLTTINFPKTLKTIGDGAFYGNTALKTINYEGSQEDANNISFNKTSNGGNTALVSATWNYNCVS